MKRRIIDVICFVIFGFIFVTALAVAVTNSFLGVGYAEEASAPVAPRVLTRWAAPIRQAPIKNAPVLVVVGQYEELTVIGTADYDNAIWEVVLLSDGGIGYIEQGHLLYDQIPDATPVPTATLAPALAAEEEYFFPPQQQAAEPVFSFEEPAPTCTPAPAYPAQANPAYQANQGTPAYQAQNAQSASAYTAPAYQATQVAPAQAYPAYQGTQPAQPAQQAYQANQAAPVYTAQAYQAPTQQAAPAPIYVGGTLELHGVAVFSRADFQVSLDTADGYYQVLAMENGYLVVSYPFGGEQVLGFVPTSALWGR